MKTPERTVHLQEVGYNVAGLTLIKNLDLSIFSGETLALLGRSGSGKTTTLKLINGLLHPSRGVVEVLGRATSHWEGVTLRRQIGYVIQEVGLFSHYTVAQNIGLVPALLGWAPEQIEARVKELLGLMDLPLALASRYPRSLSGGQRQRVGVARALAADPPILLMDEPFGALDPLTRREIQEQLKSLQARLGKTIVLVTHDLTEALALGTRIGLMAAGQLVFLGSAAQFLESTEPEALAFRRCLPDLSYR